MASRFHDLAQSATATKRLRKRDEAYEFIKNLILTGKVEPGVALNIQAIAEALGMSRTPVLEAVNLLAREGHLSVIPQVGVYVRIAPSTEIYERTLARAALEGVLAGAAAERIDQSTVEELRRLLRQMRHVAVDAQEYAQLNRAFHHLIHESARLPFVTELVDQLWDLPGYVSLAEHLFRDRERSLKEHEVILEALARRDCAAARSAMERHVLHTAQLFAPQDQSEERHLPQDLARRSRRITERS